MINFDGSISFDDRNRLPQEAGVYFLCDTSEYQKEKHMSHGWSGVYEAIGLNVEDTDMHEEARGLLERSTIEEEEGVFLVGNVRDNDSQARRLVELLTGLCAECDVQATFRLARKHTD